MLIARIFVIIGAVLISLGLAQAPAGEQKRSKPFAPNPEQLQKHESFEGINSSPDPVGHQQSPAYRLKSNDGFLISQVNVSVLQNNILGDAANEPSIAIDPNDHNRIAI